MSDIIKKIPIVDSEDNILFYQDRKIRVKSDQIYRVAALWITNSKGQILLARRAFTKIHNPGQWGPAVAGTVEEGEYYYSNIIKEAEEEIGLVRIKPSEGPKLKVDGIYNHFTKWYFLTLDISITKLKIAKDEITEVKWFEKEDLLQQIEENSDEFLENLNEYVNLFST